MNLDSQKPADDPDRTSPDWLEARLRQIPKPTVPVGLQDKLIAGIVVPVNEPVVRRAQQRLRRLSVYSAAAVALVAICCMFLWPKRDAESVRPTSVAKTKNADRAMTVLVSVQPKDIDPCNILPPLPDWR